MEVERETYRTTAEEVRGKKTEEGLGPVSWRIRGGEFWAPSLTEEVLLVVDFDVGYIAVIREADWNESEAARRLADLDDAIGDAEDEEERDRLARRRAASVFRGSLSRDSVRIPREIAWMLQRNNEKARDVTLVRRGSIVEIWPTRRWQDHLAGHLFTDAGSKVDQS